LSAAAAKPCQKEADEPATSGYYALVTPATLVRLVWLGLAIGFAACGGGGAHKSAPRVRLSAKEIVQRTSPAIVRVEAGGDRVGTGFVVGKGLVATNLHVVAGQREIRVVLTGGQTVQVERIAGLDPERDLAVLGFAPPKDLPSLVLGDSAAVSAGDLVFAVNNPLGVLDHSVFDGLISSVRVVNEKLTVLQISVPISQGSSGGPLFNQFGEVVGVTTAIITSGQSLNLAVPTNYLRPLLAAPITVPLEEFAAATRDPEGGRGGEGGASPRIVRRIPEVDGKAFDGCSRPQVIEIVVAIRDAISSGAPVYNQGNHEACFRIYEGTAIKFEREAASPAIRAVFGDGLLRAGSVDTFTDKAWAMRDTFDGVLRGADDWARNQPGGPVPFPP
jgi:S1-C subfamily serine protease